MNAQQALEDELKARLMAHGCSVATDTAYNATRSGMRSAACGARWYEKRQVLKELGIEPLPLPHPQAAEKLEAILTDLPEQTPEPVEENSHG